jgi:hypothetical protein
MLSRRSSLLQQFPRNTVVVATFGIADFDTVVASVIPTFLNIVTCMRFPWFNNVNNATTMRFFRYATILVE